MITACSQRAGMLAIYEEQLRIAGIPLHVGVRPPCSNNNVGSIGERIATQRENLAQFSDYERIIFSDAWDILFYGNKEEVISQIPTTGILMAAERNCWPDAYLANHFSGATPWRFVNGGLCAGTPAEFHKWFDQIEAHPSYHPGYVDQQWLNHRLIEGWPHISLDTETRLFYCMVKEAGELSFVAGKPFNTVTGNFPAFIHFNGKHPVEPFHLMRTLSEKSMLLPQEQDVTLTQPITV